MSYVVAKWSSFQIFLTNLHQVRADLKPVKLHS